MIPSPIFETLLKQLQEIIQIYLFNYYVNRSHRNSTTLTNSKIRLLWQTLNPKQKMERLYSGCQT
jgi:hypothetical protein